VADRIPKDPAPGSAEALLPQLLEDLSTARPAVRDYENLYNGNHGLHFATTKFRETFGDLFAVVRRQLVPDHRRRLRRALVRSRASASARTTPTRTPATSGRRTSSTPSPTSSTPRGASTAGYLLVGPGEDERWPSITGEHPSQVVVKHAAGSRRQRVAALKKWQDDDGRLMATVYTPTRSSSSARRRRPSKATRASAGSTASGHARLGRRQPARRRARDPDLQQARDADDGARTSSRPKDLNRAIDKLVLDGIVASEFAAFRQRVLTGIEIPTDENGRPIDEERFISSVSRVWTIERDRGRRRPRVLGDRSLNFVVFIEMLVQHLAAQTRTPPHYLLSKMANLAADALQAADSGLFFKVVRKQRGFEGSLGRGAPARVQAPRPPGRRREEGRDALRRDDLARRAEPLARAARRRRREAAPSQLQVPLSMCWELVGMSPKQIERAKKLLGDMSEHVPPPANAAAAA
jgi:hypothetical protein